MIDDDYDGGCSRPWVPAANDHATEPNYGIVRGGPGDWIIFLEDAVEPELESAVVARLCALVLLHFRFTVEDANALETIRKIVFRTLRAGSDQKLIWRNPSTKRWVFDREYIALLDKAIEEVRT